MYSSPVLQILIFASGLLIFVAADFDKNEIYVGCGDKTRICFGDAEGCISNKNCTFAVSAHDNRTHYVAEIQNTCDLEAKNVFFGIGVFALVRKDGEITPTYSCTPKLEDFKYIILWDGEICKKHGKIQKRWGHMVKGLPECKSSPAVDNLLDFTKHNMLVHAGEIPTDRIEAKAYRTEGSNGGTFFTNSGTTFSDRSLTLLATIFYILAFSTN